MRDANVGAQRQLHAAAERKAVNCRDHRHGRAAPL